MPAMVAGRAVDLHLLAGAYDRSADGYDERFRALQREKYRAFASALVAARVVLPAGGLLLDAGAGTALFAEWLRDDSEPEPGVRKQLAGLRSVALDASLGMLQQARGRAVFPVVGDLALPPLRPGSCALAVAFTALLENPAQGLASLAQVLEPGAVIGLSLLRDEAPPAARLARLSGLRPLAGPLPAGQDFLFLLARS